MCKLNSKMNRKIIATGAFLGMLAIILGAFGAHALKNILPVEGLSTFETGVKYQMYHALFLIFVGTMNGLTLTAKKRIFYLAIFGVCFFSGSLYLLSTNSLTAFDFRTIGFITPLGGFLLILAWSTLFVGFLKKKDEKA